LATDGKGSGLIAARRGRALGPWWHLDVSLLPPLACGGGVIDWQREPGSDAPGSVPRCRHSCHAVVRLVSRREGTLIVAGFAERDAVARRQSLKGISILALGSHRRWIPRVFAPPKVQS